MTKNTITINELNTIRSLLQVMLRRFGLLQKESSQCCGITAVQSRILYEIKNNHHMSINELAEKLGLDNSTTSRHVQGLVEKELVEPLPDPNDRRYATLALSKKGEQLESEIARMMTEYILDITQQLSDNNIHFIVEALTFLSVAFSCYIVVYCINCYLHIKKGA